MIQLEQIQREIEALPARDYAWLRQWFAEQDWRQWDSQLEADVAAGKLDFLLENPKAPQRVEASRTVMPTNSSAR